MQDVFISHSGFQKDCYAVHLREKLRFRDISVFLDERDIFPGQPANIRIEAACRDAKLAIFVITRSFLCSQWCMDEVHWVLDQRERNTANLPEILTILYPNNMTRGYTQEHLNSVSPSDKKKMIEDLAKEVIEMKDLRPLSDDLKQVIKDHFPEQQQSISPAQRERDLEKLARICLQKPDACPR